MRVRAFDALAPPPDLEEALVALEASAPADLILLFGVAADELARAAREGQRRRDERFLDDAANFFLADSAAAPPRRAAPPAWEQRALAVTPRPPLALAPLRALPRAVEMAGPLLLMAVPERAALEEEPLENAAVWIAGGDDAALEERAGRALLSPGDFSRTREHVELDLQRARLVARLVGPGGEVRQELSLDLKPRSRLSVQG